MSRGKKNNPLAASVLLIPPEDSLVEAAANAEFYPFFDHSADHLKPEILEPTKPVSSSAKVVSATSAHNEEVSRDKTKDPHSAQALSIESTISKKKRVKKNAGKPLALSFIKQSQKRDDPIKEDSLSESVSETQAELNKPLAQSLTTGKGKFIGSEIIEPQLTTLEELSASLIANKEQVKKGRNKNKKKSGTADESDTGSSFEELNEEDPLAFAASRLRHAITSPKRYVMSIDQALDGTGFAFVIPLFDTKRVEEFIKNDFSRFDVRYQDRSDEMVDIFRLRLAMGGGPISLRPENSRKKEYSVGLVIGPNHLAEGRNEFPAVILHGHLAIGASNMPEWEQAQKIAQGVRYLAEAFLRLIGPVKDAESLITVEGLAMHGISGALGILPTLGAIYTRIWEELCGSPSLRDKVREMPIGSWKKAFSEDGRIDKRGVQRLLYAVGFQRFGCDDESDATAMALTAATLDYSGKATMGRIMPTREAKAEKRRLKKEKKERRAAKTLAKSLASSTSSTSSTSSSGG